MASLGTFLLLASFVVCSYAAAVSIAGARRGSRRLIESGIGAFYLIAALLTLASVLMVHAFAVDDYTIKYVQHYSDSVQPFFYKFTSYWGGLDGSIMFWVFLLAVFGAAAVYLNRLRRGMKLDCDPTVIYALGGLGRPLIKDDLNIDSPYNTYKNNGLPPGPIANPGVKALEAAVNPVSVGYLYFVARGDGSHVFTYTLDDHNTARVQVKRRNGR